MGSNGKTMRKAMENNEMRGRDATRDRGRALENAPSRQQKTADERRGTPNAHQAVTNRQH
jgi:hypothetical protein